MNVALIDVDNWTHLDKCFPNLPLMKLSAWHKSKGDSVEWYDSTKQYDICYMSKVFSFTDDFTDQINALARYVNNKMVWWKCPSFEQYKEDVKKGLWR